MPKRALACCFLLVAATLSAGAPAADASLVRALALDELTRLADRIVVADVLSLRAAWDDSHRNIYTTVEVGVQEGWKGEVPADGRLRVRQLGGTVGDIEMSVVGTAKFVPGERSLLFLRRNQVVGWAQGKRRLRWQPAGARWLVEAADGTSVVRIDDRGRPAAARPEPPEMLDSLRARVAKLVGK